MQCGNEQTVFVEMDLPADLGRDWEWFADLNIVGLRRGMCLDGRVRAVQNLSRQWQRAHLSVVASA